MNGFMRGDLRTPEAVDDWLYFIRNRERRRFIEQQESINWGEFARGSYWAAVAYGSRLVYRGKKPRGAPERRLRFGNE